VSGIKGTTMAAAQPVTARKWITDGAALLAAVLALSGAFEYWNTETAFQAQSRDIYKVADQSARLAGLRAAVPENAILGYVTDVDEAQPLASSMLLAAQYALAPRLLQKGITRDLVLGNFTHPQDFAAFAQQRGLRLERDFGNGVLLFKKEARP
jgi:hypothetical protein